MLLPTKPEYRSRFLAGMPELQSYGSLRSKRLLCDILSSIGAGSPKDIQGELLQKYRLLDGVIRLADKAMFEYEATRNTMINFYEHGNSDDLFRAQDHFESCIIALHRGIRFLEHLRRKGCKLSDGTTLVSRSYNGTILNKSVTVPVQKFRDTAEHIEERIIQGKIKDNSPDSIDIDFEQATIGEDVIKYSDLACWCNELYQFAWKVSQVYGNKTS